MSPTTRNLPASRSSLILIVRFINSSKLLVHDLCGRSSTTRRATCSCDICPAFHESGTPLHGLKHTTGIFVGKLSSIRRKASRPDCVRRASDLLSVAHDNFSAHPCHIHNWNGHNRVILYPLTTSWQEFARRTVASSATAAATNPAYHTSIAYGKVRPGGAVLPGRWAVTSLMERFHAHRGAHLQATVLTGPPRTPARAGGRLACGLGRR